MTLRSNIIALFSLLVVSCVQMPHRLDSGRIVASVGGRTLRVGDVVSALPEGVGGADSLDFATLYVDRWIRRQVKVREAERIFSSSVSDIESLVASYRHSLLTRKLDEYYVSTSGEEPFSSKEVELYYRKNMNSFKLDRTIVKGRILIFANDHSESKQLTTLMGGKNEDQRLDLGSMCERLDDVVYRELTSSWVDYDTFIGMLPIVRDRGVTKYLHRNGVQSLSDGDNKYLFVIEAYRSAGYVAPLEIVEESIRHILTMQYHQELVRTREDQLYERAVESGVVKYKKE